jgi:hypothetical protein
VPLRQHVSFCRITKRSIDLPNGSKSAASPSPSAPSRMTALPAALVKNPSW